MFLRTRVSKGRVAQLVELKVAYLKMGMVMGGLNVVFEQELSQGIWTTGHVTSVKISVTLLS